MSTTTTLLTGSSDLTPTVNGRDVRSLPCSPSIIRGDTSGDNTNYYPHFYGTLTTYTLAVDGRDGYAARAFGVWSYNLQEYVGGVAQSYGAFSAQAGHMILGFAQQADTTAGATFGGFTLGPRTWDVTPAVNVVARWTDGTFNPNAPADGNTNYYALSGVTISVSVVRSGGATYALASGTTSTSNPGSATQRDASGGGSHASAAAVPAALYDPYFGRTPTADRDITALRVHITNADGSTYDYDIPYSSVSGGGSSVPSGSLAITQGAAYPEVSDDVCQAFVGAGIAKDTTGGLADAPPAYWLGADRDVSITFSNTTQPTKEFEFGLTTNDGFPRLPGLRLAFTFTTGTPVYPPPGPTAATQTVLLTQDLDGRPCGAAVVSSALKVYSSRAPGAGGGPGFDAYSPGVGAAPADASLVVSARTGRRYLFWAEGTSGLYRAAAAQDGEAGDWSAGASVLPGAALTSVLVSPADPDRLLLLSGLQLYDSGDLGLTWAARGAPAGLTQSAVAGRAALLCLGNLVAVAAGTAAHAGDPASALQVARSTDGGLSFGAPATVWTPGGGATLVALAGCARDGALWLAALVSTTVSGTTTLSVSLWGSGDLGATWQGLTAPAVTSAAPGLYALRATHRLLWGMAQYSDTAGASWSAD